MIIDSHSQFTIFYNGYLSISDYLIIYRYFYIQKCEKLYQIKLYVLKISNFQY